MKRFKITAIMLCVALLTCCFMPQGSLAVDEASVSLAETAVLTNESDFTYLLLPTNAPQNAVIRTYTGDDTAIILPDTLEGYPVTKIAAGAFRLNSNLEYIKLGKNIETFPGKSTELCTSLKEFDIHPENTNMKVVNGVLYNNDMTTLLAFPSGVAGSFVVPESVKTIATGAFYYRTYITNVVMYNGVEAINEDAFSGCRNLQSIRLSDNLQVIGNNAFRNCDCLTKVQIPYSVTSIGTDAFLGFIDSDGHRVYHVTDGIYTVPEAKSAEYVAGLHLPGEVLFTHDRKITDYDTGVSVIDALITLPESDRFNLTVTPESVDQYEDLIPGKYTNAFCYNIDFDNYSNDLSIDEKLIVKFNNLPKSIIHSATKVYRITDEGRLIEHTHTPDAPFTGASTKNFGTFIITTSNNFSLKGDIDGNGIHSIYDAYFALYIDAGISSSEASYYTETQKEAADMNGDGEITTADARQILRKAAGIA